MVRAGSAWAAAATAALTGTRRSRAAAFPGAAGPASSAQRARNIVQLTAISGLPAPAEAAGAKRGSQAAVACNPGHSKSTSPLKKRRKAVLPAVTCSDPQLCSKALRICEQLRVHFPRPQIPVNHDSHFQFLVAVILSAQVNAPA